MGIFTVRLRAAETQALRELAAHDERSQGDIVRRLIRQAHRDLMAQAGADAKPRSGVLLVGAPDETHAALAE